ncbi:hypothetical protein SD51_00550 [Alicyclobacillus tengchongensis]|nr:hypothetical protein SD51_00550 [Alicyclobacillus tengchongensis]
MSKSYVFQQTAVVYRFRSWFPSGLLKMPVWAEKGDAGLKVRRARALENGRTGLRRRFIESAYFVRRVYDMSRNALGVLHPYETW